MPVERVHDPGTKMIREASEEFFVFRGIAAFENHLRNLERGTASASTRNREMVGSNERERDATEGATRGEVEREENVGRV